MSDLARALAALAAHDRMIAALRNRDNAAFEKAHRQFRLFNGRTA